MDCSGSNKTFRFLFLDFCSKVVYQSFKKDFEIIIPLKNINENCVFSNLNTSKFQCSSSLIHESEHEQVFESCKCQYLKEI